MAAAKARLAGKADMGLVSRHAGIGTIVRAQSASPRYMLEVASLSELFPRIELTEQLLLGSCDVVADEPMAHLLDCAPGQAWVRFETMRRLRKELLPVAYSPPLCRGLVGNRLSALPADTVDKLSAVTFR